MNKNAPRLLSATLAAAVPSLAHASESEAMLDTRAALDSTIETSIRANETIDHKDGVEVGFDNEKTKIISDTRSLIPRLGTFYFYNAFPKEEGGSGGGSEKPIANPNPPHLTSPYQFNFPTQKQPPDELDSEQEESGISAKAFVDIRSNQPNSLMGPGVLPSVIPGLAQAGLMFEKTSTPDSPIHAQVGLNIGPMAKAVAAPNFEAINRLNIGYTRDKISLVVGRVPFSMGVSSDFAYKNANITYDDQQWTLPFQTDGILGTVKPTENHAFYGGVVNGQQVTGVDMISPGFITGYRYQSPTGVKVETDGFYTSNEASLNSPAKRSVVADLKLTTPLAEGHELKLLFDVGLMGVDQEKMQAWQVAGIFVNGKIIDNLEYGVRGEWVHDPHHLVSYKEKEGPSSHGNITLTNTYKPVKNLGFRLEYRGDFALGGKLTNPSWEHQVIAAVVAQFEHRFKKRK